MKITFQKLKILRESLDSGDELKLESFLNTFKGENVFEKFKNILKCWELQVDYNLHMLSGDKNVNVSMDYFLSEFPQQMDDIIVLNDGSFEITLGTPKIFEKSDDLYPILQIIKKIKMLGHTLDFEKLTKSEKLEIIDSLPAKVYNILLEGVVKNNTHIIEFENPALSKIKLNFLGNDPYLFLRGMFSNYSPDYFRTILFHLSKRIDASVIMGATISDIEFYIQKYEEELKKQQESPSKA